MATVVWTQGANTLTFDSGVRAGTEVAPGQKFVVTRRSAGGVRYAYNMGVQTPLKIDSLEFPNITQAKYDEILSWIRTVCVEGLNSFLHTDNSISPAFAKTVWLREWRFRFTIGNTPTTPVFTFYAALEEA